MSFIEVRNINKTFKVAKRDNGLKNAIVSFFKRKYTYVNAISNISFDVNRGDIVGYIGPNGAGKSTTLKMLSGILVPDSGSIKVDKLVPYKQREKYVKEIGVVFGQRSQLWWDIPASDTFDLLKDIYDIPDDTFNKNKELLIDMLDLKEIVKIPVRQLSLGQRMRLEIVASLLHDPKILFLDEPTIGLDAVSKTIIRDFIKKINKEKKVTIILTTHDMADIEALAKRIILIGKGKVLYDGTLKKLKKNYDNVKYIKIYTKDKVTIKKNGVTSCKKTKEGYDISIDTNKINVSDLLKYLSSKMLIDDIEVENENIDNIIVKLYKEYKIWNITGHTLNLLL